MKDKAGKQLPADPKKLETLCQESLQRCRESEAKLKAIFEGARDGIVLVDAKTGDIIDCNPEFEK